MLASCVLSSSLVLAQSSGSFFTGGAGSDSLFVPSARTFTFAGRSYPAVQALAKPIDPATYTIGPGDGLLIQVWGGVDLLHEVVVSAGGRMVVPTIGTLDVVGMSLKEVQEMVAQEAARYYRGANVAASLAVLRAFEVFVLGEVQRPGIYPATPVTRVTELLDQAGGVKPSGSLRHIEVRWPVGDESQGVMTLHVDVARFLYDGILEENPFVRDGTTIFVALNRGTAIIEGAVNRPGTYTLKSHDTVDALIVAAGGLTSEANPDRIRLRRRQSDQAFVKVDQESNDHRAVSIQDGDTITVPAMDGRIAPIPLVEQKVYVVGYVESPGPFPYVRNRSVMDYIGLAGGGDERAKLSRAVVHRRNARIAIGDVEAIQPGDMIEVPEKRLKWWQDYVTIVTAISTVVLSAIAVSLAANK